MDFQHNDTIIYISRTDGAQTTLGDSDYASVIGSKVEDGVFIVGVYDTDIEEDPRVLSYGYPLSSLEFWLIDEKPQAPKEER